MGRRNVGAKEHSTARAGLHLKLSSEVGSVRNRSDKSMRISGLLVFLVSYVSCVTQTNQMLCKSGLNFPGIEVLCLEHKYKL